MTCEVLIAGFGGQGILLAGQVLADAAMRQGYYATWFPSYGPEMRGGTANCTTIYSDVEIGSPIASSYDTVVVMNQPSLEKFAPKVRPGGVLLVNSTMVPIRCDRSDITVYYVPAGELARDAGDEKFSNTVMVGAFLAARDELGSEFVEQAIRTLVGAKKSVLVEPNLQALDAGRRWLAEHGVDPTPVTRSTS